MDKIKRTFSFRKKKKKNNAPDASKPHRWQEDETKVREATCSFQVKYLGTIEVFESRGMQVCEEAIKSLKSGKGKHPRAVLYVSGDALRVVDEISKGLIVDQTIEKVSFCAPDRYHEKGFAYICRDGATKRWICHGFLAVKESGERLSHAVGCAFAICLEKKQKREKEAVEVQFSDDRTSFTRLGSFRQTTLTEKMQDPQSSIIAEPIPNSVGENSFETLPKSPNLVSSASDKNSVPRPHAPVSMLDRQGSLRLFPKLAENAQSPFKRNLSLRLTELPSNVQRQNTFSANGWGGSIPEASPSQERCDIIQDKTPTKSAEDSVTFAASDFRRQLNALTENVVSGNVTDITPWISTNPFPTDASIRRLPHYSGAASAFTLQPTNPWAAEASVSASWNPQFPNATTTSPVKTSTHIQKSNGSNSKVPYSPFPDPFDLAWATTNVKGNASTNPFVKAAAVSNEPSTVSVGTTKAFEVQM